MLTDGMIYAPLPFSYMSKLLRHLGARRGQYAIQSRKQKTGILMIDATLSPSKHQYLIGRHLYRARLVSILGPAVLTLGLTISRAYDTV